MSRRYWLVLAAGDGGGGGSEAVSSGLRYALSRRSATRRSRTASGCVCSRRPPAGCGRRSSQPVMDRAICSYKSTNRGRDAERCLPTSTAVRFARRPPRCRRMGTSRLTGPIETCYINRSTELVSMGIRPSRGDMSNPFQWLRGFRNASATSLFGSIWPSGAVSSQFLIPRGIMVDSRCRGAWWFCQVSSTALVST